MPKPEIEHKLPARFDQEIYVNGRFRGLLEKSICSRLKQLILDRGPIKANFCHIAAQMVIAAIEDHNRMINRERTSNANS